MRTSNRKRDILSTTLGDDDGNVTINNISLFITQIIPSPETQVYFTEAFSKTFTLSYESWTTDRESVDTAKEYRSDISSPTIINTLLHLIATHQLTQRPDPTEPTNNLSKKRFNNAFFDHDKVRKFYAK